MGRVAVVAEVSVGVADLVDACVVCVSGHPVPIMPCGVPPSANPLWCLGLMSEMV